MKVVLVRSNQAAQPGQPSRLLFNFFKDFFATCLSIKIHSTRLKISFSLILLVKITHRCLFVRKTFPRKTSVSFWDTIGSI